MATNYPAGLDAFPTVGAATPMDTSGSEHDLLHNNMGDAIEALELELGAQPSGIFDSLVQRLDAGGAGGSGNANIAYGTEPASPAVGSYWLDPAAVPESDAPSYVDQGNGGVAKTVNITTADVQQVVLNAASMTLTLAGTVAAGFVRKWRLHLKHDASTTSFAVVWPGTIKWPGGTIPTLLATTANAQAVFEFTSMSDGTVYGLHLGNYT